MDYYTKRPLELAKRALAKSPALLAQWRKPGRPKPGEKKSHGHGWHELLSSKFAGSHASSAGLELIVHPLFPIAEAERALWVEDVALGVLKPFLEFVVDKKTPTDDKERLLEAQRCTVKVVSFLSASAAVGACKSFNSAFQKLQPVVYSCVERLSFPPSDGGWGHWLGGKRAEAKCPFPTAAVFDAVYRLARVDPTVAEKAAPAVKCFIAEIMDIFGKLLAKYDDQPPAHELWQLLPALRSIAVMDACWLDSAPADFSATRANFERLFNAYIRHDLFGFGLNHTDDFQKYRLDQEPSGTDYVAFNTTACVARAIIAAIETGKLHPSYAEWIAPHLCTWAEQLCSPALPQPARFSYIHQTLSCLLAAVKLDSKKHCIPGEIRMNIFPRVFSKHSFARKAKQGFYVTPFDFEKKLRMKKSSEALFADFRAACKEFSSELDLVRGDHSPMGVITERIWRYINESEFLIALCVGANANVYYEVGVAHTLGKPVLLIGRKNSAPSGSELKSRSVSRKVMEADFKFDIAGVHHAEFEVSKFDFLHIQPQVNKFLEKVYGKEEV